MRCTLSIILVLLLSGLQAHKTPSGGGSSTDMEVPGIRYYSANTSIFSSLEYNPSEWTRTHYKAGDYIQLTDGFKATGSGYFEAQIGNCPDIVSEPLSVLMKPSGKFIMSNDTQTSNPKDN